MIPYSVYFLINYLAELVVTRLCLPTCELKRLVAVVFILNLVTHPILWFFVSSAYSEYWIRLLTGEGIVFALECLLGVLLLAGKMASGQRVIVAICAANMVSFSLTFLI